MSYNFVNPLCVSIKQTYFHTLADLDCVFFLATYVQVSNGWEVLWSWWGFSDPNAYSGGYVELLLSAPCKGLHTSPGKWQTPIEASCLPWSMLLQRKNKTFHVLVFTCWHTNIAVHLHSIFASRVCSFLSLSCRSLISSCSVCVRVCTSHVSLQRMGPFQRDLGFCWLVLLNQERGCQRSLKAA